MDIYKVKKLNRTEDIVVEVPGSKSITNRALLLAALSDGITILKGTLFSDDSRHFLGSLISLGFKVDIDEKNCTVKVEGKGGAIPNKEGTADVGSAGTAARFITAMLGLSDGCYTINASEQMKKRPMEPLFKVLEDLGAEFEYLCEPYHLPVKVKGCRYDEGMSKKASNTSVNSEQMVKKPEKHNGSEKQDGLEKSVSSHVTLDTNESTQYLSAMLMTGVMNKGGIAIHVTGERKTGSYVDITRNMMKEFGCNVEYKDETYFIYKNEKYKNNEKYGNDFTYQIEPDVSAACYFYGIGALLGIKATVKNVHFNSTQGDIQFVKALEKMGCKVDDRETGISVKGPVGEKKLKGIDIDMKTFSDQALTMAAVSIFAEGDTVIRNVGHIRKQESDRLSAMAAELGRMGIKCEEYDDSITIHPGMPSPCQIETYEDHRVAMAFTLVGLVCDGIEIKNPMCCRKTFEKYFEVIDSLYL